MVYIYIYIYGKRNKRIRVRVRGKFYQFYYYYFFKLEYVSKLRRRNVFAIQCFFFFTREKRINYTAVEKIENGDYDLKSCDSYNKYIHGKMEKVFTER